MTDTMTKKPLRVYTDGTAGPYLMVSLAQLDEVRALLDGHNIGYWVDETAVALDGRNYITVVNLGLRGDAKKVQAILDAA